MPQFHLEFATLSIDACKALLAFASKDATRPHLCCVGVCADLPGHALALAATNGHALLVFGAAASADVEQRMIGPAYAQRYWPRAYVERQVKLAAVDKSEVTLHYADLEKSKDFPQVINILTHTPSPRNKLPAFDAGYLALLAPVQKACSPNQKVQAPTQVVYFDGPDGPAIFTCKSALEATVAIMPQHL